MSRSFVVKLESYHYKWSKKHKPVLHIRPGDEVVFEISDVTSNQMTKRSTVEDLMKVDESKLYPLAGPVFVEGASSSDTLLVDVVRVKTADWGYSPIIPGFGLLDGFDIPYLFKWELPNNAYAHFKNGIRVCLKPFCGTMGVAPKEVGFIDARPPGYHGGNMDIKHLTAGSMLKLPIWTEGALFSAGDMHAAQGDGEVCGTAIECPGEVTLRFDLEKNRKLGTPQYLTPGEPQSKRGYVTTIGIAPDLMAASKEAVENMVRYLANEYELTRQEAYVLCSVAADLRIHELVDRPNWVVGMMISRDLFPSEKVKR